MESVSTGSKADQQTRPDTVIVFDSSAVPQPFLDPVLLENIEKQEQCKNKVDKGN